MTTVLVIGGVLMLGMVIGSVVGVCYCAYQAMKGFGL